MSFFSIFKRQQQTKPCLNCGAPYEFSSPHLFCGSGHCESDYDKRFSIPHDGRGAPDLDGRRVYVYTRTWAGHVHGREDKIDIGFDRNAGTIRYQNINWIHDGGDVDVISYSFPDDVIRHYVDSGLWGQSGDARFSDAH